ncbi:MAG: DnaD domain protein [Anaerolineae bacterium]
MKGFSGFPAKGRLARLPALFFSELLPQIDSLAELKVTLYCFWRLQQPESGLYLREHDIRRDEVFMQGLAAQHDEREAALKEGLERAVARGTLLQVRVEINGAVENLYFVNTARGRAAVKGIEENRWQPDIEPLRPYHPVVERPTIYTLYEQNIGPLTPLIAEHLRAIEETYPQDWIEEAIAIAVKRGARRLAYIEAVLKRWQEEGRSAEDSSRGAQRFISGKYGDEIEH